MVRSPVPIDGIDDIVAHVQKRFATKPKVAFAGFGNAGKSSLLNAIYGSEVARVSMRTDETTGPQVAERFGIDFTDTPGMGTSKFSLDNVLDLGMLQNQHLIIHVLNGAAAISAEDEKLQRAIRGASARSITVVNKVDLLDEDEKREFLESVFDKLGLREGEVMMVSAKRGIGVPELVQRITELLPSALQDAFIAQQKADSALKEKRIRALIYSKAGIASAVALAPIPVADILVLTPIQMAMVATIGYFHGIEVTPERATELMGVMGAGMGLREAARQLVKLIPGYGMVVSAGIAFAGTVALGEAANVWFKRRMKVDAQDLRELFTRTANRAKEEYALQHTKRGATVSEIAVKIDRLRADLAAGKISREAFDLALAEIDAASIG
ncbi:MAG TPA: GTPase, partial [Polyangiaceae bacterium]|nr:GTPase [Polyangiaceae bacterium]